MMLSMGMGLRLGLKCTVCYQWRDEARAQATSVAVALFGAKGYAVCPCCEQPAPDQHDRNYRRRVRRFLAR